MVYCADMGKATLVLVLVAIFVVVNARDVGPHARSRVRRGFSGGGFGGSDSGGSAYGRSDEQDASVSREALGGCSGESGRESGRGYIGGRDLAFNRDGRESNENRRGGRSFTKSSASASAVATAFNQNQNQAAV